MSIKKILQRRGQYADISLPPSESDTALYMNALNIPDDNTSYYVGTPQEKTGTELWAIMDNYITGLKNAGLWSKIGVEYPIIGGTAARHGINLKDPLLHVVSWVGGWIHNELGAKGNGSDTYANTGVKLSDISTRYDNGLSYLSGEDIDEIGSDTVQVGAAITLPESSIIQGTKSVADPVFMVRLNSGFIKDETNVGSGGFWTASRTADTITKGYKNGVLKLSGDSGGSSVPNIPTYFGAANFAGDVYGISTQRFQNVSFHLGLTDSEVATYYNLLLDRETALGRKTWI